jgi:hypothetical protein
MRSWSHWDLRNDSGCHRVAERERQFVGDLNHGVLLKWMLCRPVIARAARPRRPQTGTKCCTIRSDSIRNATREPHGNAEKSMYVETAAAGSRPEMLTDRPNVLGTPRPTGYWNSKQNLVALPLRPLSPRFPSGMHVFIRRWGNRISGGVAGSLWVSSLYARVGL